VKEPQLAGTNPEIVKMGPGDVHHADSSG
jgi:hypothetical protein